MPSVPVHCKPQVIVVLVSRRRTVAANADLVSTSRIDSFSQDTALFKLLQMRQWVNVGSPTSLAEQEGTINGGSLVRLGTVR